MRACGAPGETGYAPAHDARPRHPRRLPSPFCSRSASSSELAPARPRLRTAGRRKRLHPEASRQGEEADGRRRPAARRRGGARHPAQRRKRGRCRHRHPDGAQFGRAAILGDRRRRLSFSIGTQPPRQLASIDGRETAPSAATPELFLDADGNPLPRETAMASGLSVGVPGVLAALKLVHDKYGKLPWAELFQPAIALARDGFPISPRLAAQLAEEGPDSFTPRGARLFLRRGRQALAVRLPAKESGACRDVRDDRP